MIRIRPMIAADLPSGMRFTHMAGWNQTEADWRRCLDLEPEGCFVAELDGTLVGTTTTCVFGPVAWVAMVLVDTAVRRRGVGRMLMLHALEFLDGRGVRSVRLDATPMGQPLYEQLGFRVEFVLARHEGVLPPRGEAAGVRAADPARWDRLLQLDRAVTGTDRGKLLRRLFLEQPDAVRVVEHAGEVQGFLTARPGRRALHIGPCLATGDSGPLLLADARHRYAGQRVYLDIPTDNTPARQMAEACGLTDNAI
jgi:GNAT superfamily N-acetyltransferase